MATVPTPTVYVTGQIVTAAQLNGNPGSTWGAFVLGPPSAALRATVTASIGAGGSAILFDTEDSDNDLGHSTVTNTSRYTAQTAGTFLVAGQVGWAASAATTSTRWNEWRVNGTAVAGSRIWLPQAPNATDQTVHPARTMRIALAVGDFLELWAGSPAGATSTFVTTASMQPSMTVEWVST